MIKLSFCGGANEIGGNKILLEDGDTRIFLDLGMSFNKQTAYRVEYMTPRKPNGTLDFVEFGMLPNLKGIYRKDYAEHDGIEDEGNIAAWSKKKEGFNNHSIVRVGLEQD